MMFEEINNEELILVDGGANGWMIAIGAVTMVGGVIACLTPAGVPEGVIAIAGGAVLVAAGIVY